MLRFWDQQVCKQWTEASQLVSLPAWLGISLLSLIHPDNLNPRKWGGVRMDLSS